MTDQQGWRSIETAPRDGTEVWLRLASGYELPASWSNDFSDGAGNVCGCWIAWAENMIPPSWDDAVCWEVNAAGVPSDQPVGWMHPPAQGGGDE